MITGLYGTVVFGVLGRGAHAYYDLHRHSKARFSDHDIHLQKPVSERTGPGLVELDFMMNLSTRWGPNPHVMLAQLKLYHDNGIAALLWLGAKPAGPGMSLFTLRELDESHKFFSRTGIVIGCEVQVKMVEHQPFQALYAGVQQSNV
jgi:Phage P2 GpU